MAELTVDRAACQQPGAHTKIDWQEPLRAGSISPPATLTLPIPGRGNQEAAHGYPIHDALGKVSQDFTSSTWLVGAGKAKPGALEVCLAEINRHGRIHATSAVTNHQDPLFMVRNTGAEATGVVIPEPEIMNQAIGFHR